MTILFSYVCAFGRRTGFLVSRSPGSQHYSLPWRAAGPVVGTTAAAKLLLPVYRQYSSSEIFDAKHGPMVPSWGAVVDDAKTILSLGSAVFVGEQPLNFLKGASFLQTALSTP